MNVWQFLALARTQHDFSYEELKAFNERLSAARHYDHIQSILVLEKRLNDEPSIYRCRESRWLYPDYLNDPGVGQNRDDVFCAPYMQNHSRYFVYAQDRHGESGWCNRDGTFWIESEDQYVTSRLYRVEYFECGNCGNSCHQEDDNVAYSDSLGESFCSTECCIEAEEARCPPDYDEDDDCDDNIYSYTTRIESILPMSLMRNQRYFGIELEQEFPGYSPREQANYALDEIDGLSALCIWKSDGSLNNGAELVSLPKPLSYWQGDNPVKALCKDTHWRRVARSHNTTTCGLHVHVSRSSIPEPVIAKIVYLMNEPCMHEVITLVARRNAKSTYSVASKKRWHSHFNTAPKEIFDTEAGIYVDVPAWKRVRNRHEVCKTQSSQDSRYTPVNLTRNTIEFRIFKGTLKWETVLASIEFCEAVISYCTQYGASRLNDRDFTQWLKSSVTRKTYPTLRDYLTQRTLLPTRRQKPADKVTEVTVSDAVAA